MVANAKRQHILPNIKDCEFMALSPGNTALLVKNSNTMVDVLDGDTLDLAFNMRCDLAKCLYLAQKLIFVGTWQNQVSVFDVTQRARCFGAVQAAIDKMIAQGGMTVRMIAHRPSTLDLYP